MVRKSKSNCYKTAPKIKAEMLIIKHGVDISVSVTERSLGLLLATRSLHYSLHKHTKTGWLNSGPKLSSVMNQDFFFIGVMGICMSEEWLAKN